MNLLALRRAVGLLAAALALAGLPARAEPYPSKPVRIVVPFPPGGAQDVLARLIAEPLAAQLKQPVVVENRAGAAGNLGAELLAKSAADGYTLGILSGVHTANSAFYRRIGFHLERDFVAVRAIGESAVLIAVSNTAPVKTIPELLEYAKAHPGKLQLGTTTSQTVDLLKVQTGLDVQLIPYKGVGDALQDLIGGRLDLVSGPALQMIPLIQQGKIRGLGLASTRPVPELPGVAPFANFVPGYDAGMWYGLFAPAGTPPAVVRTLNQQVGAILARPEVRAKLAVQGVDVGYSKATPEVIQSRIESEIVRWRRVAAKTGNYAN